MVKYLFFLNIVVNIREYP